MQELNRQYAARIVLWQIADGGLFVIALGLAYMLRTRLALSGLAELEEFSKYLWLTPVVGVLGPAVLATQGFYDRRHVATRLRQAVVVARGCVFATLGLILFLFLVREQFARSVVIFTGTLGGIFAYLRWEVVRWFESTRLGREQLRRRVVWIGAPDEMQRLRAALDVAEEGARLDTVAEFDPAVRTPEELARLLREQAVNLVVIALAGADGTRTAPLLAVLNCEGVEMLVQPGLPVRSPDQIEVMQAGGETLLWVRTQAVPHRSLLVKNALDVQFAVLLLVVLAPVLAVLAVAVRLTSPGPALFRQPRAGLNGRPFAMWKFRSMRVGAETEQSALAGRNEMRGPVFKVTADPRVTPLGRWMRRHGLDELPQLWNVVRSEMSLVGPRPLPVEEVARFAEAAHRRRLSVRPGLTCLWQISGRNDIADFDEWVRLDLAYIDQWSLALDLKILVATIPAVLFGRGGR